MVVGVQKLLVVDDDAAGCRLLRAIFVAEGFEVLAAQEGREGIAQAHAATPDIVLLDLRLPGMDGLEVLAELRSSHPDLPVIMLTADADIRSAVRATRLGAFDYLTKPFDPEEIVIVVRRALETSALKAEVLALRRQMDQTTGLAAHMGPSAEVARVVAQARTVADSDFSVLVLGETGTGKELVAQAIHRQSGRRERPFIALDCGAIPEALLESELFGHEKGAFTGADKRKAGRFRLAQGGTLFLDEVGNLPLTLQAKLLRVLESREMQAVGAERSSRIDVRFVAATNDDLRTRVGAGQFRADLYFRLAQYTISLPPLRERCSDVAYLAQRFMSEAAIELRRPTHEISSEALALLEGHGWPGNVRELRNVIRQCVLEAKEPILDTPLVRRFMAQPAAAESAVQGGSPAKSLREVAEDAAREAEHRAITQTLRATAGNKAEAARALRTDYKTLHLKMKGLGIRAKDFSP